MQVINQQRSLEQVFAGWMTDLWIIGLHPLLCSLEIQSIYIWDGRCVSVCAVVYIKKFVNVTGICLRFYVSSSPLFQFFFSLPLFLTPSSFSISGW